ncbi:MAG: hypothetical protein Q9184_000593 [Pyrenodesmia sp. 2 TL-2023]
MASMPQKSTKHINQPSVKEEDGLNDVALSSACSLHTAAASIKSSSDSLRQRGLSEIVEDASESQVLETQHNSPSQEQEVAVTSVLQREPVRNDSLSNAHIIGDAPSPEPRNARSPQRRVGNIDKALPPTPGEKAEKKATTRNALEDTSLETRLSLEGRPSIQSKRPSIRSMRTSHDYRPKVKLGPRPSLELASRMHGSERTVEIRPISTLPNSVRLPAKKQAPNRPKSANGRTLIPETSEVPLPSLETAPRAKAHEKTPLSLPSALPKQLQPTEIKTSTMTPEKRRLKKALELRQKQLGTRNKQPASTREETPQRHFVEPSQNHAKRESLTATLPNVSPGDDGSTDVLQERIDALDQDPDVVHVGPQNLGKDMQETFEVSPISAPEASDGPSTQASSISEEDETPTRTEIAGEQRTLDDDLTHTSRIDEPAEGSAIRLKAVNLHENHLNYCFGTPSLVGSTPRPPDPDATIVERQSDINNDPVLSKTTNDQRTSAERGVAEKNALNVWSSTDPSGPLYIRRSSSSKSIVIGPDVIKPHEIPLPPIGEDEEVSLSPQRNVFLAHSAAQPLLNDRASPTQDPGQALGEENKSREETGPPTTEPVNERRERRIRRHGLVNPIKRVSSPDYSDDQFLSDDSFMEELKSATVQEAKPISVSKSPIMPVFPQTRSISESKSTDELRPASAGSRLIRPKRQDDHPMIPKLPDLFSARSASASHAPLLGAQLSPPLSKKLGVSSGISQRIKALEQLSSRPTSPASQLSSPPTASVSTSDPTNRRKTSFRASQAAAEITKASTQSPKDRPPLPLLPTPRSTDRSRDIANDGVVRIDVATKAGKTRPESISVTARIVRGSRNKVPEIPKDPSQPRNIDLYPSPLIVEHQSMRPTSPPSPLKPPKPSYARSMSSTSGTQRSDPLPTPRRDSISSRLSSTPSRRGSEPELPRTMSDSSINSATNCDGSREERKESRKSRLFKRMSNISAASRRSIASALSPVRKDIKEEPIVEHNEPSRETIRPVAVEVGDVNIQFPDTLLWKRRHMQIDEQGVLVLSASKADNNSKVIPKRYPFTEFNPPYLPDQDQQELPNSVILDFRDGSTLQCACENPYTQNEVFRALKQAHQTYNITP